MQGLEAYQKPKWETVDQAIELWLAQRQALLIAYYAISHTSPFKEEHLSQDDDNVQHFMQLLLDYVSAGHFDIFEKINEAHRKHPEGNKSLDRSVYVALLQTTMGALEFHDHYGLHGVDDKFKQALSDLGEALALRFDLEDSLIENYLKATNV